MDTICNLNIRQDFFDLNIRIDRQDLFGLIKNKWKCGRTTHVPYARIWSYEIRFDIKIVLALTDDILITSSKFHANLSIIPA